LGAQFFDQIDGLLKRHVAIVVAMDQHQGIAFTSKRTRLSTFPGEHHPVPYGQADILNARVRLDETVKGNDGLSISILGIYHFAAPKNIVAGDQPARFE
jgi:hypothetical protein